MYLKKLIIFTPKKKIQEIIFKDGMNLIVDDTPLNDLKTTGNNVGKTTVLKLIDYCLGAQSKIIYTDEENRSKTYDIVKDFLIDEEVSIILIMCDDLSNPSSREVIIERNFLTGKKSIRRINGKNILAKDFETELESQLFPDKKVDKPTFRQIISYNIRYGEQSINNTTKMLNKYTSNIEYENLFLYLLGCNTSAGDEKQILTKKIIQEESYKRRLENNQTISTYRVALTLLNDEIKLLNQKKSTFNLNVDYEADLENLNRVKYNLNRKSSKISKLKIKKALIEESIEELKFNKVDIDLDTLRLLYKEATLNVDNIQKSFEDLVNYHNTMISEKTNFISQELPAINMEIAKCETEIISLLENENILTDKISKGNSFEELEKVIFDLNEKYRQKGEFENLIYQIDEVETQISNLSKKIEKIDEKMFSKSFEDNLNTQLDKFNKNFSNISYKLYNEKYALKFDIQEKNGRQTYVFNAFNANLSSGKKQGEIVCFDLANIIFSRQENRYTLNFLLNDKKELMHDNQLIKIADFVQENHIQFVISILKDKLPEDILLKSHIAIELSQDSKLFKIEGKS